MMTVAFFLVFGVSLTAVLLGLTLTIATGRPVLITVMVAGLAGVAATGTALVRFLLARHRGELDWETPWDFTPNWFDRS